MKKLAKYFAVIALLVAAAWAFASGETGTFTLESSLKDPMPGEEVTVTFKARFSGFDLLYGIQDTVKYDVEKFDFVSAQKGTELPCKTPVVVSEDGEVSFGLMNDEGVSITQDKDYVIGTFTLRVKDNPVIGSTTLSQNDPGYKIQFEGENYNIPTAEALELTITEIPTGSVKITLSPDKQQKFVISGEEHVSGYTYEVKFPRGSEETVTKTVSYDAIDGYFKPETEQVTIREGYSFDHQVNYVEKGKVTVTLSPDIAKWSLDDGTTWNKSGATVEGLEAKQYTIKYSSVDGYITPKDGSFTVVAEEGKNVHNISTNYAEQGALVVTITDPAGAKWYIDGESSADARASGASVKVNEGNHTIYFTPVVGYTTHEDESVYVPEEGCTAGPYYYEKQGSLKYTLSPDTTGAQWSIDGTNWKNSGDTINYLDAKTYTVQFKAPNNYFTPANEPVTVDAGAACEKSKNFTEKGVITVTIDAIQGASPDWYLNGAKKTSGTTVSGLDAGTYTITFDNVPGYHTPTAKTVTVKENNAQGANTFSYNVNYGDAYGYVNVTFAPTGVAGKWSVDGSTWYEGSKDVEIKTGTYTIQFSDVEGYDKTDSAASQQNFVVEKNKTTAYTATYVKKGTIASDDYGKQTESPDVKVPEERPVSVLSVDAGVLTDTEEKNATQNLLESGLDKVKELPAYTTKVNMLTSFKLDVLHGESENEDLEFTVTLKTEIKANGKQVVAMIPSKASDKKEYTSFNATYNAETRELTFTVKNYAKFFTDAPVLVATVDTQQSSSSSGGGCNAGFAALALIAAVPFIFRKRK